MKTIHFHDTDFPTIAHAQWALVFDDLLIPWRFRPETFALAGQQRYEPDFWLPRHRLWFQLGGESLNAADIRRWRSFAAAADAELCEAREEMLDRTWCPTARPAVAALPPQWLARDLLYAVGGIPAPEQMIERGHAGGQHHSMYTATDRCYQWTSCRTCGYVGAELDGRADRLACGHGDAGRDADCRANDPRILAAYRLARQSRAARIGGTCARCTGAVNVGDLVAAGRAIGHRRWYHAGCLLLSRRERSQVGTGLTGAAPAQRCGAAFPAAAS
ncbi:hypothetical protein AB0F81_10200 [Actinoplanes sp. NPDC024001]|uniref:hypothetical protein n=1 Tax=Actinoplanes sp. NPDC024001 TaxID=3154598 RepID=UPI0033C39B43